MQPLAITYLITATILLTACPGSARLTSEGGTSCKSVNIKGRVVDFETCATTGGCKGVPDLKVSLYSDPNIVSNKTNPDGSFVLSGVIPGVKHTLVVKEEIAKGTYLSSIQAESVISTGNDLFGLEIYVLMKDGGLFAGIKQETGINIDKQSLYLGQVVYSGAEIPNVLKPGAVPGATAQTFPALTVRYVRSNPRLLKGEPTLFDATTNYTGGFGEFVVMATGTVGDTFILVTHNYLSFNPYFVPLEKGYITIGVHRTGTTTNRKDGETITPKDMRAPTEK